MSFRNIVRDVGSLSRRSFEATLAGLSLLTGHHKGKSTSSVHELNELPDKIQESCWANLPPELLREVIRRLEESESSWPSRKHVVFCAAVCRSWRQMSKEIVVSPEFCAKLTFPLSLKQPGPREGVIQCYIKRDKNKSTYHLYLCLTSAVLVENGKFLLSAKRKRKATYTEFIISMESGSASKSSSTYIGKIRSNFLGTKFVIYDTQPPPNGVSVPNPVRSCNSKKVSPRVPSGTYSIAQVTYELNVLGTRGPRRMHCIMHTIPASSLEPGGTVPSQAEQLLPRCFEESFRSTTTMSNSIIDPSGEFGSARFSDIISVAREGDEEQPKEKPLVLKNKPPRWHEQLQCWCLNFRGRVTIASVKNFQLIAAAQPTVAAAAPPAAAAGAPPAPQHAPASSSSSDHDKIILQFGKVARDMFTMDYRYPLSAFQAFAICLSSFDTKLACE